LFELDVLWLRAGGTEGGSLREVVGLGALWLSAGGTEGDSLREMPRGVPLGEFFAASSCARATIVATSEGDFLGRGLPVTVKERQQNNTRY